jgi:hypothetical protein
MRKIIIGWLSGLALGVSLSVSFLSLKEDTYDWYIIRCNQFQATARTLKEIKDGFQCRNSSMSVRPIQDSYVRYDLMMYDLKRLKAYLTTDEKF